MIGIMVGVGALICVLSVFNGFSTVVTDILVGFDPHIRITAVSDSSTSDHPYINNADSVTQILKDMSEIESYAPVITGKAIAVHYTLPKVIEITASDEASLRSVSGIESTIASGEFRLDSQSIILGQIAADNIAAITGDTLELYSSAGLESIIADPTAVPIRRMFIVRGIFASNNRDYDAGNAYVNADIGRQFFRLGSKSATAIEIRLKDFHTSQIVKQHLEQTLRGYKIESWFDLHKELYNVMEMERWVAYVILLLIVAVASFGIFSSLTLTVFEKKRDIGLLTALGATSQSIRRIFLIQGIFTGVIGIVLGVIVGIGVVLAQKYFAFFTLDQSVYIIPALPVELRVMDIIVVSIGAFLLFLLASLLPSRRAAEMSPAESLKWE
jgi:lipoprotein-releasing system permease protein